jgi:hypothetical protein
MKKYILGALGILLLIALLLPGCSSGAKSGGKEVVITYSANTSSHIGTLLISFEPKPGNIFIVLDMTIENHGYATFALDPLAFSIVANGATYKRAMVVGLENEILMGVVKDNSSTTGKLAFEVPADTGSFDVQYKGEDNDTIRWVKQ